MHYKKVHVGVKLWDFAFFILVVFPLLTGGIWYQRPGLFIELSDIGIPVLSLGLVGLALRHKGVRLQEGLICRGFFALGRSWQDRLRVMPLKTLGLVSLFFGSVWFLASLRRHLEVNNHVMDLSIFYNAIWNLSHGHGYFCSPKGGINLFADHQSPLFWLFVPLIKLFPDPVTLLFVQDFALTSGGIAVFYLAKQYLGTGQKVDWQGDQKMDWRQCILPLLYWSYLPLRNAAFFDFHVEVLMLPLFLFAIAGIQSVSMRNRVVGGIFFLLALASKESAPPIAAGIGLAWLLGAAPIQTRKFCRKVGFFVIPVGICLFYFYVKKMAVWFGAGYAYQSNYSHFGSGLSDVILAPFTQPRVFFSYLLGPLRLKYLFWTLGPLGFLPLLNPVPLLAALPSYLMLFLAEGDRVQIWRHYGVEPAIGLFWAMGLAFQRAEVFGAKVRAFGRIRPPWNWASPVVLWSLFWALLLFGRSDLYNIRKYSGSEHGDWLRTKLVPCIAPDLSVSAPIALSSHLASRYWISFFPSSTTHQGTPIQCIIHDSTILGGIGGVEGEQVLGQLRSKGYGEIYQCRGGTFRVLQHFSTLGAGCMVCRPDCEGG